MEDYYEYKTMGISPYRRYIEGIFEKYKASDRHSLVMEKIFQLIMDNTFIYKDNNTRIDLKKYGNLYKEPQDYFNNNLNIQKYLVKHTKNKKWDEIYINSNKGRAYIEIRSKRDKDSITERYLNDLISYIDSGLSINSTVIMFCNIDIDVFGDKIREFLSIVKKKEIKTLYMSNYTHIALKNEVDDSLNFIFTEREKALNHFVCIVVEPTRNTQRIFKRDPTTGINFGEHDTFKKISPYFTRHHANRMLKILQDSQYPNPLEYLPQSLLGESVPEARKDIEERHTIMITKDHNPEETLSRATKNLGKYLHELSIFNVSQEMPLLKVSNDALVAEKERELKVLRNKCLKEYNLVHTITNANTAILKTSVWMIYSLKLLELHGDNEKDDELRKMLNDTKQNSQIWRTMRKFRKFFQVVSPFPIIEEEQVTAILKKIHFEKKSLSGHFPDIPFSSNMYALQDSLESIIFDDTLRMRLAGFLNKQTLTLEHAAIELSEYLEIAKKETEVNICLSLESSRIILLSKSDLKASIEGQLLEKMLEHYLWQCSCSLNEKNAYCECDGGLTEDDWVILDIQVYSEKRLSVKNVGEVMIHFLLKSGRSITLSHTQLKKWIEEYALEKILEGEDDIKEGDHTIKDIKLLGKENE